MIELSERWFLDSDNLQFILYEKTMGQDGKRKGVEVFTAKAFCGNIEQLKNWIINQELKDNIELLNNIDKCIELSNTIDRSLSEVGNVK